jgi:cytidylate kinase
MVERDRRDSTRADSPLKAAEDAITLDSTGKTIQQVFEVMMKYSLAKAQRRKESS